MYFYYDTTLDPAPANDAWWENDRIELFVNPNLENDTSNGAYKFDASQMHYQPGGVADITTMRTKPAGADANLQIHPELDKWGYSVKEDAPTGYTVEIFRPWIGGLLPDGMVFAELGNEIGFTININDSDVLDGSDNLYREAIAVWAGSGEPQLQSQSTNFFGTLILSDEVFTSNDIIFADSRMHVYPNPARAMLRVKNARAEINIFNMLGQKVLSADKATTEINISKLNAGMYVVQSGKYSQRLIIK